MNATIVLAGAHASGKSALARALATTGATLEQDPLSGATFVTARTAAHAYRFVDAPEQTVPQAIAGGANAVVLVVSITDGVLPATRAHLQLARSHAIPVAAVYLFDPADTDVELAELVELETRELLASLGAGPAESHTVVRSTATRGAHGEPDPSLPLRALADALDRFFVRSSPR